MERITIAEYKVALKKRYKDLRDTAMRLAVVDGIDYDSKHIKEMNAIAAIAKLHGVDIKE